MDFTKFDLTKMFDITTAIDTMEKGASSAVGYLPEQVRGTIETVNKANFELARVGTKAVTKYMETVQKVAKESAEGFTKTVEKAVKATA